MTPATRVELDQEKLAHLLRHAWELAMSGACADSAAVLKIIRQQQFAHVEQVLHVTLRRKMDEVCVQSQSYLRRAAAHSPSETEEDAVWQRIAIEAEAFWMRDFDTFATCFIQEPRFRFQANIRPDGLTLREGWQPFAHSIRRDIELDPLPNPFFGYGMQFLHRNLTILGDMAWCTFVAECRTADLPGFRGPGTTHDLRIMERQDGQWRTVLYGINSANFGQTPAPLWEIDSKGRVLWQNPAATDYMTGADDVFIGAGRLRIRDHLADQKLSEAIASIAAIDHGIMAWRTALPVLVDPGYDLPRTVWWVIFESGKLFVSYNDNPQLLARLNTAGKAFALSPGQMRLACALVEGLPLHEAAQREGVSLSTAKTQLQRIFDKVGVRNQPALVRALLAVTEKN